MKKILVFIVAYNAEKTIKKVLSRIPKELLTNRNYTIEVLIIDDASKDTTFAESYNFQETCQDYPLVILKNPKNLGYGGNQKLGYRYALDYGFDMVVLLHGDAQYAPELLQNLIEELIANEADAVFGSRMMIAENALKGGMPKYKFYANKFLTAIQNKIVGTKLSEYHSGYRCYSCKALEKIPFELNSNDFDFDTEIIIQLHLAGLKIREIPIPTHYGEEICYVNGFKYARQIVSACLLSRLQSASIFYDPKYDLKKTVEAIYRYKYNFQSSHSMMLENTKKNDALLIVGCGAYSLVKPFLDQGCDISCIDLERDPEIEKRASEYIIADLDFFNVTELKKESYNKVLLPDIIEHLRSPEKFLKELRNCNKFKDAEILITTPNIAFFVIRLMLLIGNFSYGKSGILDLTHTRLFTFNSLKRTLLQQGFIVKEMKGIPAPFPLAIGDNIVSRTLLWINSFLIKLSPGLFSYQTFTKVQPAPTVEQLLENTLVFSENEKQKIGVNAK